MPPTASTAERSYQRRPDTRVVGSRRPELLVVAECRRRDAGELGELADREETRACGAT